MQAAFIDTGNTETEGDNRKPHGIQEPPCHLYKVSESKNVMTEYRTNVHDLGQMMISPLNSVTYTTGMREKMRSPET